MCIWSVLVAWCWETLPTLFLSKVIPQQGLFEMTALVRLCCLYNRRFKPSTEGSRLELALDSLQSCPVRLFHSYIK